MHENRWRHKTPVGKSENRRRGGGLVTQCCMWAGGRAAADWANHGEPGWQRVAHRPRRQNWLQLQPPIPWSASTPGQLQRRSRKRKQLITSLCCFKYWNVIDGSAVMSAVSHHHDEGGFWCKIYSKYILVGNKSISIKSESLNCESVNQRDIWEQHHNAKWIIHSEHFFCRSRYCLSLTAVMRPCDFCLISSFSSIYWGTLWLLNTN